ncbi:MAG: ATP-binding protein [Microbacteriaceae bacterium]|nr:ATP-binding protein [Microbacteriaceae bacterium]MCL2795694.1 ATP-binding protein [Microbacteriaceae bacterium]
MAWVPTPSRTTRRPDARRRRLGFTGQAMVLQLVVVVAAVAGAVALTAWFSAQQLTGQIEQRALAVARTTASNGDIRTEVGRLSALPALPDAAALRTGTVQQIAEEIRRSTGALYVVVTDESGLRLSHPDASLLGQPATGRTDLVLHAGRESTDIDHGGLGLSARARVPIFTEPGGRVIGEVSVGFPMTAVDQALLQLILPLLAATVGALAISGAASTLVARRLRRLTRDLEPEQIANLLQDQEVVLHGIAEGVLGVAPDGRVTVCTARAQRMLQLGDVVGQQFHSLALPAAVGRLIEDPQQAGSDTQVVVGEAVLRVLARRVTRGTSNLGWVLTIFDRTQIVALTNQLDAVAALSNALRVQRHEFANRLHTATGLLDLGDTEEAARFLHETLENGPLKYPLKHSERLNDPYLKAFLGAKGFEASERGVLLRLGVETLIRGDVADPQDITTVLGNLIDNAVEAAVRGSGEPRWVEVELMNEADVLHLVVADSGDGVVDGPELPFVEGHTTAEPAPGLEPGPAEGWLRRGHGLGLPLSRRIARALGGDVWLASAGAPGGPGAVFCARLPGVVRAGAAAAVRR